MSTLTYRQIRKDQIQLYKVKHDLWKLSFQKYFHPSKINITRGHHEKILKPVTVNRSRANFWRVQAVTDWNSLLEIVVKTETLNSFKNGLD
jgi:hypothetical protein